MEPVGIAEKILSSLALRRRVKVLMHRARFLTGGPEGWFFFMKITNRSLQRDIEVTHVWYELPGGIRVTHLDPDLPKRLNPDETWETWIETEPFKDFPDEIVFRAGRVRLSSGRTVKSRHNKRVPPAGPVARRFEG